MCILTSAARGDCSTTVPWIGGDIGFHHIFESSLREPHQLEICHCVERMRRLRNRQLGADPRGLGYSTDSIMGNLKAVRVLKKYEEVNIRARSARRSSSDRMITTTSLGNPSYCRALRISSFPSPEAIPAMNSPVKEWLCEGVGVLPKTSDNRGSSISSGKAIQHGKTFECWCAIKRVMSRF